VTTIDLCCGLGGSGKTTTAAALGLAHAASGRRAVVLTIDPARRLANALHIPLAGGAPTPVPVETLGYPGSLAALMLDRSATFDAVVRRFSPDADTAARLLANRYYRAVSTRLTGAHEYMAMEKLAELVESGAWDAVVLDTPPTQHLLDFLDAPERILAVFDRSVFGALGEPGGGLLGLATRRALGVMERVAGASAMGDIREFMRLISGLSAHFRERGRQVRALLDRARYLLVINAHAPERTDLDGFLAALAERDRALSGLIVTRVAVDPPAAMPPSELAGRLADVPRADAGVRALIAAREAAVAAEVLDRAAADRLGRRAAVPTWRIPDAPDAVRSLAGLATLVPNLLPLARDAR
jgi:anion-transporting  ArsA/GET3 family ATPase